MSAEEGKRQQALIAWIKLYVPDTIQIDSFESLKDCKAFKALVEYLTGKEIAVEAGTSAAEWLLAYKLVREIVRIIQVKVKGTGFDRSVEQTALARRGDITQIENLCIMLVGFAIKSAKKAEVIDRIKGMQPDHKTVIKGILQLNKVEATDQPAKDTTDQTEELKKRKTDLEAKVAAMRAENAKIKDEIEQLKKAADAPPLTIPLAKGSGLKAKMCTLKTEIENKKHKLTGLESIRAQLTQLQERVATAKQEEQQLKDKLEAEQNKEPDYTILTDRLNALRTDPQVADIAAFVKQKEELKQQVKEWEMKKRNLEMRMEGQQGITKRTEDKQKLQALKQKLVNERRIAEINLIKSQKRMREDAFLVEMQSFI